MAKVSKHRIFEERKQMFLQDFAKEAPQIRESIVKDLPAYNTLLSLEAETFEEFALKYYATKHNVEYNKNNPPIPDCPYCNTNKKVGTKEKNIYRCTTCGHTFSANYSSVSSGTKCDALTWMKVLRCLLDFAGISKTCEYCDISRTTYYKIRSRLFYAMQVLLEDLKLYGIVEVDNTFVRSSYKGYDLSESEFDEDSIFFDDSFKPRTSRKHGGSYSYYDRNANSICIFTAIDDSGHVISRFAGIGAANYRVLSHYIPFDKYLLSVPSKDPFCYKLNKQMPKPEAKANEKTLMVADKEQAIEKYAKNLGVEFESHVYRKNGVQLKLPKDAHNIQRVNALHHRLKEFLQKHHYISTKYLPGYLILFEFLENTGASTESINQLFQILAQPNFDKPANFFDEMFVVPNYLQEWLIGDNPLNKLPYYKLLGYYLYDHIKNKEMYHSSDITMQQIIEETGYTEQTIRKHYRELTNAGYRDLILSYFNDSLKTNKSTKTTQQKHALKATETINPIVLAIYDAQAKNISFPPKDRLSFQKLLDEKNEQYGTSYKRTNMLAKFKYIEELGLRQPLDSFKKMHERVPSERYFAIANEFNEIALSYRKKGEKVPNLQIQIQLGKKYNVTHPTITKIVSEVNVYNRKQRQKNK